MDRINYIFTINPEYPYIYCRKLKEILKPNQKFWGENCLNGCPYFNGSNQGNGVECKFENVFPDELVSGFINLDTNKNRDIIKDIADKIK